jgi:hypothetical protein
MSGKSMLQHKRRFIFIIVGGLILLISSGIWMLSGYRSLEEYRSFARSDGHYRVTVMRTSVWPALMPGQASDAPGVVQLYDRNDNLLQEAKVEMVQFVDQVEWGNKSVHIKLVADWELPD